MTEPRPAPPTLLLVRRILVWMWGPRPWLAWCTLCALGSCIYFAHPAAIFGLNSLLPKASPLPMVAALSLNVLLSTILSPHILAGFALGVRLRAVLGSEAYASDVTILPMSRAQLFQVIALLVGMLTLAQHVVQGGVLAVPHVWQGGNSGDWSGLVDHVFFDAADCLLGLEPASEAPKLLVLALLSLANSVVVAAAGLLLPVAMLCQWRRAWYAFPAAFGASILLYLAPIACARLAFRIFGRDIFSWSWGDMSLATQIPGSLVLHAALLFVLYAVCRARFVRGPLASEAPT